MYSKDYRQARYNAGFCYRCCKNICMEGRRYCEPCIIQNNKSGLSVRQKAKLRKEKAVTEGICYNCELKPIEEGNVKYCHKCAISLNNYNYKRSRKRGNKIIEENLLKRKYALNQYGHKCACCGESNFFFLDFDHIHNDGTEHRLQGCGNGTGFMAWLKRNNYPKDSIQVLCSNCNQGKRRNKGICPHKDPINKLKHYGLTIDI